MKNKLICEGFYFANDETSEDLTRAALIMKT